MTEVIARIVCFAAEEVPAFSQTISEGSGASLTTGTLFRKWYGEFFVNHSLNLVKPLRFQYLRTSFASILYKLDKKCIQPCCVSKVT